MQNHYETFDVLLAQVLYEEKKNDTPVIFMNVPEVIHYN